MNTLFIARQQIRLLFKSPNILLLFVAAPFFMIYIFGQAFTAIFAASGTGIRAMDYFGVTLFTLAVFNGAFIASWGIFKERKSNTETRLAVAPIGKGSVVFGTFLGAWISLLSLSLLVLLLVRAFLSVEYGTSMGTALLLTASESFLAAAIGVSFATICGQEQAAGGIISTLVPLLVFLGGGYVVIPESGFLHDISYISPVRWINLAMLTAAEPGRADYAGVAFAFCALVSALLLCLAGMRAWRRK